MNEEWIMLHTAPGRFIQEQELIRCDNCVFFRNTIIGETVCRYHEGLQLIRKPEEFCSRAKKWEE